MVKRECLLLQFDAYDWNMRKFLQSLMIVSIFVLGMVCAMPSCIQHEAQAASPSSHPCHEGHKHSDQTKGKTADFMFYKDCSKTELQKSDPASLEKKKLVHQDFPVVASNGLLVYDAAPSSSLTIRGPPPDWPDASQTYPSILLTTQRFLE